MREGAPAAANGKAALHPGQRAVTFTQTASPVESRT
jgi:hypothetical protein